jgi:hypothetical protein
MAALEVLGDSLLAVAQVVGQQKLEPKAVLAEAAGMVW